MERVRPKIWPKNHQHHQNQHHQNQHYQHQHQIKDPKLQLLNDQLQKLNLQLQKNNSQIQNPSLQSMIIQTGEIKYENKKKQNQNQNPQANLRDYDSRKNPNFQKFNQMVISTIKYHLEKLKNQKNFRNKMGHSKINVQKMARKFLNESLKMIHSEGNKNQVYWLNKAGKQIQQQQIKTFNDWLNQYLGSQELQRSFSDYVSQNLFSFVEPEQMGQQTGLTHRCQCKKGECQLQKCGCVQRNIKCIDCECDQSCQNRIQDVSRFLNLSGSDHSQSFKSGKSSQKQQTQSEKSSLQFGGFNYNQK